MGTAGLVTTGILVFDIITDPILGWLSDRTNTRWGRRAPWMVVGALVLAGGTVGLFSVPAGMDPSSAALWVGAYKAMKRD